MRGHAVHDEAYAVNLAAGDDFGGCDIDQREIPHGPVANLFKIEIGIRPGRGNSNGGEKFARLQSRHARDIEGRTDEIVFGIDYAFAARAANHHLRVQRDKCRSRIRRADGDATVRAEDGVLAIDCRRRIGKTGDSPSAIAVESAAVIPAARILGNVAADGALIANLW